ncbi:hypothetical protein T484DRAFT_1753831 [Baffinella frigidus]|nr:hypothetical protein T484DRAFT_1753831 [Cryptophyta sp. CCMP2293]
MSCFPISTALCVTSDGNRFFPSDKVFVVETSVGKCVNGQGRSLLPELKTRRASNETAANVSIHRRDDTSLCDVIDNNMDIIYDPVNNHIFAKELSSATWLYTTISSFVLIVVVLTAEAVSQRSRSQLLHNIIAWVLLTLFSALMLMNTDGRMHTFVTVQDRAFISASLIYIIISTLYWIFPSVYGNRPLQSSAKTDAIGRTNAATDAVAVTPPETQRDGINAMLASVHFATCVLYGTPDNSYVSVFFFSFLFRSMQKLHDTHYRPANWTLYDNTMLLLDVVYTVTVFTFGVLPHFTNDAEIVLYTAAQYMVCDTIAANYILDVSNEHPETPPDSAVVVKSPSKFIPPPSIPQGMGPGWTAPME